MTEKKKATPRADPATLALEAANQALAAANAAVQAAVKALALTRGAREAVETRRGKGSIRNAASQARHRLAGGEDSSGVAPLAAPTRTPPRGPAAAPRAAPKPARAPKTTAPAGPEMAPTTQAAAPRPASPAPPVPAPPPAPERSSFAARKGRGGTTPPPAPVQTSVHGGGGMREVIVPAAAEAQPEVPTTDVEARTRPTGSGPIILGAGTQIAPAPVDEPPILPPPAAPVAPPPVPAGPTEAELRERDRREAELKLREEEMAEREAAMARYAPMEPAHPVPAQTPVEANGYTVLVVDDEEQVRALTVRILSRFGYRVLEASGVELALSMLDRPGSNVDLVLSDVAMPGLSGKDLFRAISESRPGLPVVFMSGYALGVYAPEGLIEEGVKMLPKPFGQEDLLGFITEALEGAAAR